MRRLFASLLFVAFGVLAHGAAVITLTSAQVSADGKTWTATLSGGTGTGLAITNANGITIVAGAGGAGLRNHISGQSIVGTTLTLTLGFPIGSGWTACTFTTTASATITDDGGNTVSAQTNVAFTNNSTTTVTSYLSTATGFRTFGAFTQSTNANRSISTAGSVMASGKGSGFAFRATATDVAFVGFMTAANKYQWNTDAGSYTTSALSTGAVATYAVLPIVSGISEAAHDYEVIIDNASIFDRGVGTTTNGTILVAGTSPALAAPSTPYASQLYYVDTAIADTWVVVERTRTETQAQSGHTNYFIPGGQDIRFRSNSSMLDLFSQQSSQSYALYQDGNPVAVATKTAASGSTYARLLVASGLDTGSYHDYKLFVYSPVETLGSIYGYEHYLGLDSGSLASVAQTARPVAAMYGDSITKLQGITDARSGYGYIAMGATYTLAPYGYAGQRVVTYLRDNTAVLPAAAGLYALQGGINDVAGSVVVATFQTDYATMIDNVRTRAGSDTPRIYCFRPFPCSSISQATIDPYGAAIAAAVPASGDANAVYIDTTAWLSVAPGDWQDGVHPSVQGYAKLGNRMIPIFATTAITLSGPASGPVGDASTNFTVTIAGAATFTGDQTVTISDGGDGGTITPSLGAPGTSSVTVTPTAASTSFTFTYTPASSGAKTITPTAGSTIYVGAQHAWTMPTALTYTASSGSSTSQTMFFLAR